MKQFWKIVWNWLTGHIKIGFNVDVYIFVNNQWIKVDIWQINEAIEKEKQGIPTGILKIATVHKGKSPIIDKSKETDFVKLIRKIKKESV